MNLRIGLQCVRAVVSAFLLLLSSALLWSAPLHAGAIQLFSVPKAREVIVSGINASGTIAGACYGENCGRGKGYVRTADGTVTTFRIPHIDSTNPTGINDGGAIVGHYTTADGYDHGFLRNADGTFTMTDVDGSSSTYPAAINKRGDIAGTYYFSKDIYPHGFVRAADGTVTTFDVPGAAQTVAGGINSSGIIVGGYAQADYVFRGFVRTPDGAITTFDVPNSMQMGRYSINDKGEIAGAWEDSATSHWHAFLRTPDGTITPFDVPNSQLTEAEDINARGQIVGYYIPQHGGSRGFLRSPGGNFTSIVRVPETVESACINRHGVIAGGYGRRRSLGTGGFVRTR